LTSDERRQTIRVVLIRMRSVGIALVSGILTIVLFGHPAPVLAATTEPAKPPVAASGELSIYTAWDERDINALIQGFNKVYPKVKVSGVRSEGGRGALLERLLTEIDAGKPMADIYSTGIPDMSAMLQRGELLSYHSPSESNIDPRFVFKDGLLHPSANLVFMTVYNRTIIPEKEAPRTWEDLLNPKWKGKIAIDQEPNDIVAGFLILMGKEKGESYLRQLSKNVIIRRGRSLLVELLTAGEFPVSIDVYAHRVAGAIKDGAPLAAAPMPAYFSSPNVDAILKRAPHVENAKLWIDWLQSPAGQEVVAKRNRGPVGKTEGTPDPTAALVKGREQVVMIPAKLPMGYNEIARLARDIFLSTKP
jgi:iron(III) transport system substrate-binding protein